MRLLPAVLFSVLVLGGCATSDGPTTPDAPSGPASLGGVNLDQPLRALGTEPFWSVDISHDALVLSGPDRPNLRAAPVRRTLMADSAVFRGETAEGVELTVTLSPQTCSDGMSDRTYPLTARVLLGDENRMSGCAASTSAIMSAGESGPVRP